MGKVKLPKHNPEAQTCLEVPRFWCSRLGKAKSPATFLLAFLLLDYWRRFPGRPLDLGSSTLPKAPRQQRLRAIAELESLGLIVVRRQATKAPIVTWVLVEDVSPDPPAAPPAVSPPSAPTIKPGSEQWIAWVKYLKEIGGKEELLEKMDRAEAAGRWMRVPREWPLPPAREI
jgi:hypothetical protein